MRLLSEDFSMTNKEINFKSVCININPDTNLYFVRRRRLIFIGSAQKWQVKVIYIMTCIRCKLKVLLYVIPPPPTLKWFITNWLNFEWNTHFRNRSRNTVFRSTANWIISYIISRDKMQHCLCFWKSWKYAVSAFS